MPWDPLREALEAVRRLDEAGTRPGCRWSPPVDVYETDDRYVLTAELPGLTRADITLETREGELTLRGERRDAAAASGAYVQLERGQGPFVRTFVFAEPIDADRIHAELRDGVLTVTVPKAARPQPRRIAVT
ncbi:MAG TPA: Hsp20/alpha crystallin family protein [Vicinamibacterales bacterium]|nr:Hsp20/alpha crystallin family protein [Vicinamibacterales bacterium]